jgi:hypothetical protein
LKKALECSSTKKLQTSAVVKDAFGTIRSLFLMIAGPKTTDDHSFFNRNYSHNQFMDHTGWTDLNLWLRMFQRNASGNHDAFKRQGMPSQALRSFENGQSSFLGIDRWFDFAFSGPGNSAVPLELLSVSLP